MHTCYLLLVAVLLATPGLAQKAQDSILKTDGARLRNVEITEFLLTGVRGTRGNERFEVAADQVVSVEWGNAPPQFLSGRAALVRGDVRAATQMFGDVKSQRPLVQADAAFFKIKCAVAAIGNDQTGAATVGQHAKKWLVDYPQHWRTPEVLLLKGRAERLAGANDDATTTLLQLDQLATRAALGTVWSLRAKSELALTLLSSGKASEARTTFQAAAAMATQRLAATPPDDGELQTQRTMARIGEGETFLVEKDYVRAQAFFHELAGSQEDDLAAAGLAGEGEAVFLAAVANNQPADLRRAQLRLAAASVRDARSGDTSAKANYYLGRCVLALGRELEGDAFRQRASAYFQLVVSDYPSSRWIGPALAALGK